METFVWPSDKFWKVLRNFGNVVGNFWKIAKIIVTGMYCEILYNKKENHMVAWRSELSFLMLKNISLVHCILLGKYFVTLEDKLFFIASCSCCPTETQRR